MTKYGIPIVILLLIASCMWFCAPNPTSEKSVDAFLNLNDSVEYVGMQMCQSCHQNVYQTYIQTGMGQSFGKANLKKTAAEFGDSALVYDKQLDFYYKPYFQDSVMYVMEFRLNGKDTVHKRIERIDYIIGSGHHTNSHMINRNGYVYQAPITYYTQDKKWDLAPGFEENNERFGRAILSECLTCHNHTPTPATGSDNKYHKMPLGIECERCHGPGGLHVKEKLMGKHVDTSKYVDYSIVNPKHLPIDRQMDLCQRCHLQGVAVLNEGKTFYDFKPGMELSDVMNVFLPRFTNSDKRFIMASQADRLQLSDCFNVSKKLSCITCHNPHHDVHSTTKNNYNTACLSCHKDNSTQSKLFNCSAPIAQRNLEQDNCVGCHMPRSGSIDIPHVNITDHHISKNNIKSPDTLSQEKVEEIAGFLGLESLVIKNASPLEMARGYLALWDKFMGTPAVLDSAKYYLDLSKASRAEKFNTLVHYYFNKQEYALLVSIALAPQEIQDAWTAYRIGEAAYKNKNLPKALAYYKQATNLKPYSLIFQEKLGSTYAQSGQLNAAKKVFNFILKEDPNRKMALANLGLLNAQQGNINQALQLYNKALALDPDYKNALLNKVGLLLQTGRRQEAQPVIQHLIKKYPNYQAILEQQGIL
ncbi:MULTISPECIES: M48 family metallopeptidase [unclassified Aureispira]|uniref:tetratricopeptide repeat protein n=1 Tax=unclassified Aureispira TaxID=2649989 RepID=UPI000698E41D|nr:MULTISPECIES: tetratricopeptide repeat protein [unclassified Aureispira]WMX17337.1 tetratricopeptide repeat protein [Aureispira sp. CCB-E]